MSSLEIHRLSAVTPASVAGSRAKSTPHSIAADSTGRPAPAFAAPREGVSVELRAKVEVSQPPVDSDRVAEIKSAIQKGQYPIVPAQIADAMIAARLMLGFGK